MSDLITSQMLSDWRANYGLDKRTPIKAMHWWQDNMDGKAPAGVVAALGLCINEIERLTAERNALRDDNAKLNGWMEEEAQAAGRLQRKLNAAEEEIERLTASLKRANETAEHFERHWYLRGDEIERLTKACRRAVIALAAATDQMPVFAADYAAVSDALKEQR